MKGKNRQLNEISAGSMADIAFLLLVFFFICTSIVEDEGILVQLPPYEFDNPPPIPSKNIFNILLNSENKIMTAGKEMNITQVSPSLKEFVLNPNKLETLPGKSSKAIVSFQCDRGTEYESYILVYNELKKAYQELWAAQSQIDFGKPYSELSNRQQKEDRNKIPMLISETEPEDLAQFVDQ